MGQGSWVRGLFALLAALPAYAFAAPGYVLVFQRDATGFQLRSSADVDTYAPPRGAPDVTELSLVVRDAHGRSLAHVGVSDLAAGPGAEGTDPARDAFAVRVPAPADAAVLELRDAQRHLLWRTDVDAAFRARTAARTQSLRRTLAALRAPPVAAQTPPVVADTHTALRALASATETAWSAAASPEQRAAAQAQVRAWLDARRSPLLPAIDAAAPALRAPLPTAPVLADTTPVPAFVGDHIEVTIAPVTDSGVFDGDWSAFCFLAATGASVAQGTAQHGASLQLGLAAGEEYWCSVNPSAPYVGTSVAKQRFVAGQVWQPLLRRGVRLALDLRDGEGRPLADDQIGMSVATEQGSYATLPQDGALVVPREPVIVALFGPQSYLLGDVGPRRFDADGPLVLTAPLRGRLHGSVNLEGGPAYNVSIRAYRHADGQFVRAGSGYLAYALDLPQGRYDIELDPSGSWSGEDETRRDWLWAPPTRVVDVAVQADTTLDLAAAAPARTLFLDVDVPTKTPYGLVEFEVAQEGRVIARPLLGSCDCVTSTTVGDRIKVRYALKIVPGRYDLRVAIPGTGVRGATGVDLTAGDVTLDLGRVVLDQVWRSRLLRQDGTPVASAEITVKDGLQRVRHYVVTNPDGTFELAVARGWDIEVPAPDEGASVRSRFHVDDPAALPAEVRLQELPFVTEPLANGVQRLYRGDGAHPLKLLFLGDGYTTAHETYTDTNQNGRWDGVVWYDVDHDGVLSDADRLGIYGDVSGIDRGTVPTRINEPFEDVNGDGFPNVDDAESFRRDVRVYMRKFLGSDYWSGRRADFEADALYVPSRQSGTAIYGDDGTLRFARDTALKGAEQHGILQIDWAAALELANQAMPDYDQLVVLLNQPIYQGRANASAGSVPGRILINGGPPSAHVGVDVVAHESGHALGALMDEYAELSTSGDPHESWFPNVTTHAAYADVRWKRFLDPAAPTPTLVPQEGVGVFNGAYYTGGIYRPSWNSIMRSGYGRFDAAQTAAIDARMARLLSDDRGGPPPGNWYDRKHSGHGIDLQRYASDPQYGDVYYVVFYTYSSSGEPEWYTALGRISDGTFVALADPNGNTLTRVRYVPDAPIGARTQADGSVQGNLSIDFRNTGTCRVDGREDVTSLGAMTWSIGAEHGSWCIEPVVSPLAHGTPDRSGHWYAPSDPGFGLEVIEVADGGAAHALSVLLYYPAADGRSRWAAAYTADYVPGQTLTLYAVDNGYCRTCTPPPAQTQRAVGQIALTLDTATREAPPGTPNRATIHVQGSQPGDRFDREAAPIALVSMPL